ncbi:hypothetical protein [Gulosibacter sp. 10]|uniref:hypothetical protein n=1 Tax=Gulosibacter sp. 10 TaxID=1255570 RepID=UPI0020CF0311|nr:hypothetical protein [Gulosibacter sp. 10]
MVARGVIVRGSALKHRIAAEDGIEAATRSVITILLDDENPQRVMRLGFDTKSRLLETVVLLWDDGTEELIHVMKARPQYVRLLE